VLQVQGSYEGAREECRALQNLIQELVWAACLSSVNGATGKLRESYAQLHTALDRYPNAQPGVQSWVLTSLAEMAARAGMAPEAEAHFRAALTRDGADNYLLGAYADFLLDNGRPQEVLALLRDKTRADPLLLRYALALQAQNSKELPAQVAQLLERFEASRLRGDRVHLREEARFTLHLLHAPEAALKLARANWQVQKEPADVRSLLGLLLKYPGQALNGTSCGRPCAELLRLDLRVPPTAPESQSRLGAALGGDPAGYPNGRRPNDDVTDIVVRVVGGTNYIANHIGDGVNFLAGAPGMVGTDITANGIARNFPFLPTPYDGKNRVHVDCGEPGGNACQPTVP
jgi:tetratricopeptide (TPR) repeat protein